MPRQLEITAAAVALLVTLVGGTVAVESRYAKAQDVREQLKPPLLSAADRAMLLHLQQELREATE